jgi:hypothetical protein
MNEKKKKNKKTIETDQQKGEMEQRERNNMTSSSPLSLSLFLSILSLSSHPAIPLDTLPDRFRDYGHAPPSPPTGAEQERRYFFVPDREQLASGPEV